jgi:hypothetical protein
MTGSEAVQIMKDNPGVEFHYTSENLGLPSLLYKYGKQGLIYRRASAEGDGGWEVSLRFDELGQWERIQPEIVISAEVRTQLSNINDDIFGDVLGACQAIDYMIQNLNQIKRHISSREYESASNAGYTDISSNFIFLQRCLGGLNSSILNRAKVIQQIAFEYRVPFEDVEPKVQEVMQSFYSDGRGAKENA